MNLQLQLREGYDNPYHCLSKLINSFDNGNNTLGLLFFGNLRAQICRNYVLKSYAEESAEDRWMSDILPEGLECNRHFRRHAVADFRDKEAKTIIGIYARHNVKGIEEIVAHFKKLSLESNDEEERKIHEKWQKEWEHNLELSMVFNANLPTLEEGFDILLDVTDWF